MLDRPVSPPFRQVSRVVHFCTVSLEQAVKRVVHELLRREPGKIKISGSDAIAANAQFSCSTKRQQFVLGIQNIDLCIRDRRSDMYIICAFDLRDRRIHGCLCRTVVIKYVSLADLANLCHNMVQKGLPAQDHGLKIGDELLFTSKIHQKLKSGRRSREQIGFLPAAELCEQYRICALLFVSEDDRHSGSERYKQIHDKNVKYHVCDGQSFLLISELFADRIELIAKAVVYNVSVIDAQSFRFAGRSGSIDHVAEIIACRDAVRLFHVRIRH